MNLNGKTVFEKGQIVSHVRISVYSTPIVCTLILILTFIFDRRKNAIKEITGRIVDLVHLPRA